MKTLRGILIAEPLIVVATILFGSLSILVSFFDKTAHRQTRLARLWAKVLLIGSGVRVRIEGLENIAADESYVFVSNHLSYMDTPVILASIPVQFRFLAKRGLFQIPFLGTHLKQAGHIPVPLDDARASVRTLQLAAATIREKKTSLLIFPEGGRSMDGNLDKFKEGGAYIGIRAGVPLVPVVLLGTRELMPYGGAVVRGGDVILRILSPIPTLGMTLKDRGRVTEELHDAIARELGATVAENTLV